MSMGLDPNIFMKNMNLQEDDVMKSFGKIDFNKISKYSILQFLLTRFDIENGAFGASGGGEELDMAKLPKLNG